MIIILTADQAANVRGEPVAGHALEPRPLADGTFGLSVTVLSDPFFVDFHDVLAALPQEDSTTITWAPENPY